MIKLKTKEEIEILREGGKRLAELVQTIASKVKPGVTTAELDELAQQMIKDMGDTPAFLGYTPDSASFPYPAALCMSVDHEIVHGIPNDEPLKEGQLLTIDGGVVHGGLYTDHAVTVPVGEISDEARKLMNITKESLAIGIKAAQPGNTVGDIGAAIQKFVDGRYFIIKELAGHGVGYGVHEDPYVPNYGQAGEGEELVPGLVIAIEPMLAVGTDRIFVEDDGYTISTKDDSLSAHFEHTIAITEDGPIVLTKS